MLIKNDDDGHFYSILGYHNKLIPYEHETHLQRHMHFNHTNHKNRQPSSLNQIYTLHNLNGMLFISERNSITMTYQPQN